MTTPLQGPTGQNPISPIEQNSTPLVNASGVKEHKPPTFQETVNKLKRGFNNLVLSNNKRVVKKAYVKQKTMKKKFYVRVASYRHNKKEVANVFCKSSSLDTTKLTKKEWKALYYVLEKDQGFRESFLETRREALLPTRLQCKLDALAKLKAIKIKYDPAESKEKETGKKPLGANELGEIKKLMVTTRFAEQEDLLDQITDKFNQMNVSDLDEQIAQIENKINQGKTFFNKLPMEAKKTFIDQNKNDVKFLSDFSNVYKEELKCIYSSDPFNPTRTESQLFPLFKEAILANKDQIIKNPTILASADKASVLEVASTLQQTNGTVKEEDKPLMKALLTAYATVDANIIETQLKEMDENATFTEGNMQQIIDCFNNPEAKIQGELQALKDVVRGFSIDFSCPSGKKISIPEQSGASQETVFNKIKEQVSSNELNDTDKNALADFLANCSIQGMFSIKMPGETSNQMRIDGDGRPKLKVQYSQGKVEITIQTQGKAQQESKFTDANFNEIGIAYPTAEAEIVFTYDKESLSSCKNKTSNIKVKKFHQRLGETFVGSEILALKGLQKIKNENKVNAALDITEFDSLMSNPQILQENIRFLDTNPAALSKIPEKTLQHYIQEARDNNNDALSAALQKAHDNRT